jgi:hypothetical protein
MNNGISFKFNFETEDAAAAFDLMPLITEKMRGLARLNHGPVFKSVEINLMKPGPAKKTVCLTIHTHDSVIREEAREQDWREALAAVFKHVEASHEHPMKMD